MTKLEELYHSMAEPITHLVSAAQRMEKDIESIRFHCTDLDFRIHEITRLRDMIGSKFAEIEKEERKNAV